MTQAPSSDSKDSKNSLSWKVFLKGMIMGAADVVPGVSGGTLALILGVYRRFLNALSALNLRALQLLFQGQFKALWQHIDGTFLLLLFAGILTSIFTLTRGITYMIAHQPILLWAFFNGLILASLPHLFKQVRWSFLRLVLFVLGIMFALGISSLTPTVQPDPAPWVFFGAGFIAICAMILPGISGSFLLLILGMYAPVIDAVSHLQLNTVIIFAAGCLTGLLAFSKLLNWALSVAFHAMLAFLIGVILGSMPKIWPWQIEGSLVWPTLTYFNPGEAQLVGALLAFGLGILVLYLLQKLEQGHSNASKR